MLCMKTVSYHVADLPKYGLLSVEAFGQ